MAVDVRVEKDLGGFALEVEFRSPSPVVALYGPSGSGKTTVLNMVAGVLRPDRGRIEIGGRVLFDAGAGIDVPAEKRGAGYIFQDGRLFPHLSVRENLLYGARRHASGPDLLDLGGATALLGIEALLDRRPATLSGGEAQRVAIGRALLAGARFLLLDEPLSYLDAARREEILRVLERVRDELGLPMLYVSHERAEVERLGADVVTIEGGRRCAGTPARV